MRLIKKSVLAVLGTALLLSLAAGMATARTRIEVSTTAALASGRLTFNPEGAFAPNVICDVTLHISLRRLINKINLELAGALTAILTANIRSEFGTARSCTPLAGMTVHFGSIGGTLPNIERILLWVRARFLIEVFVFPVTAACLYEGLVGAEGRNPVTSLVPLPGNSVPLEPRGELLGNGACPATGELAGAFAIRPTVTVRLLER